MNNAILNNEVQEFIEDNLGNDITQLVLKGSPFKEVSIQEIANQIVSKNKCKVKLPTWYKQKGIYFPNKLNIEQSSSEITAAYKSKLLTGDKMVDITGGFGVDTYYFSNTFNKVVYCELDEDLIQIVKHNNYLLKKKYIEVKGINSLTFLENSNTEYDLIYADPSRRYGTNNRVFLLKDLTPNIPDHLTLLFEHTNKILLKLSPLLDLTSTIHELKFVKEIHVVAVQNEIKELLFYLEKNHNADIHIKTINFNNLENQVFNVKYKNEAVSTFSLPLNYLYEPNNAILKAGLFNEVSHKFAILKLHNNSHLYTSVNLIKFPGRIFKIIKILNYNKKKLLALIPSKKANITVRNFPGSVQQIRKKTGIKEGGDDYLFFTTNLNNNHIIIYCKKV